MAWHCVTMAEAELVQFKKDLARTFKHEIAAWQMSGYTLFDRREDAKKHVLFVPPAAALLFDRLPAWRTRLRPYEGVPNLKQSLVLAVR